MTETLRLRQRTAALLLTAALALGAMGAAATAQPAFADDVATDSTTTPATTAIDKVTVSKAKFTYTGNVIRPKITVKAGGKTAASNIVKSNADFTIKPSGAIKKVGTYKIKVTGQGAYTGTKTVTVKVYPKKPTAKKPSTTSSSAVTAKWSKGKNDVSGYQIKCSKNKSMKGAKTVTAGKSVTSKKISGLKANTKYYVQVRAYKTVEG